MTQFHDQPSEKSDYIALRLSTLTPRERSVMEQCLKNHPGLTPDEYMELVIAYGF